MGTRTLLALLLVCGALLLGGCVTLPRAGAVKSGPAQDQTNEDAPFDFNPGGPKRDSTPVDIVNGFLTAMQATPLTTAVARQYLTAESSSGWVPEKGTVVFGSEALTMSGTTVTMRLDETVQLDSRGEWLGDQTGGKGLAYDFRLVREKGQWRISDPPDRLIVPRAHFETRFQQYYLYFFDKSAQVLVPEPVYLPRGEQAPTLLVAGLLRGPDRNLLGAERTFIPARTKYDLSVPVSRDGTAEVPLSDDILDVGEDDLRMAMAQLAWTLRQVQGVERLRITVDGSPIDLPGQATDQSVDDFSAFDPAVNWASQELFGVRDGRVVTLVGDQERRISGLFGAVGYGLRSIAVDLPGELVAGVSADGRRVLVAPRARATGTVPSAADADTVYAGGTDVLRPAWDIYGQLWVTDRTAHGAALSIVRQGALHRVTAPGITGENVSAFVVSRDGTRVVAVIEDGSGDRLVVARVMRDQDGRVRRIGHAAALPVGAFQVEEIRDVAWSTPGSVAILAGPTSGTSQVIISRIDGSSALGDVATNAEIFRDEAARVVTSPSLGSKLYVGTTSGLLFELAADGRWTGTGVRAGLRSPTYVG